jgi:hypothetical protein
LSLLSVLLAILSQAGITPGTPKAQTGSDFNCVSRARQLPHYSACGALTLRVFQLLYGFTRGNIPFLLRLAKR